MRALKKETPKDIRRLIEVEREVQTLSTNSPVLTTGSLTRASFHRLLESGATDCQSVALTQLYNTLRHALWQCLSASFGRLNIN